MTGLKARFDGFMVSLQAAGGTHVARPHEAEALKDIINSAVSSGFVDREITQDKFENVVLRMTAIGDAYVESIK